jgi:hypothetical protein
MAKSKEPAKKPKTRPSLPVRTAAKLGVAARSARTVVRAGKATLHKAKQAPGAARMAMAKVKSEAQAAGHMANTAAEQATKVIAITAGVVAGIVESVSHHDAPPPAESTDPAKKPTRARSKAKNIATTRPSSPKSDKKSDGQRSD